MSYTHLIDQGAVLQSASSKNQRLIEVPLTRWLYWIVPSIEKEMSHMYLKTQVIIILSMCFVYMMDYI